MHVNSEELSLLRHLSVGLSSNLILNNLLYSIWCNSVNRHPKKVIRDSSLSFSGFKNIVQAHASTLTKFREKRPNCVRIVDKIKLRRVSRVTCSQKLNSLSFKKI